MANLPLKSIKIWPHIYRSYDTKTFWNKGSKWPMHETKAEGLFGDSFPRKDAAAFSRERSI